MNHPAQEFTYEITLDELPREGRSFTLDANETQRKAVAKRLGVPRIDAFGGEVRVRARKDRFDARGRVGATLLRECVVSLEEVEELVDEPFEISFLRRTDDAGEEEDISVDSPEIHEDKAFDLGELLIQQLSLAMNPFPRKEGANSLVAAYGPGEELSPFAQALAQASKKEENQ